MHKETTLPIPLSCHNNCFSTSLLKIQQQIQPVHVFLPGIKQFPFPETFYQCGSLLWGCQASHGNLCNVGNEAHRETPTAQPFIVAKLQPHWSGGSWHRPCPHRPRTASARVRPPSAPPGPHTAHPRPAPALPLPPQGPPARKDAPLGRMRCASRWVPGGWVPGPGAGRWGGPGGAGPSVGTGQSSGGGGRAVLRSAVLRSGGGGQGPRDAQVRPGRGAEGVREPPCPSSCGGTGASGAEPAAPAVLRGRDTRGAGMLCGAGTDGAPVLPPPCSQRSPLGWDHGGSTPRGSSRTCSSVLLLPEGSAGLLRYFFPENQRLQNLSEMNISP